MLCAYRDLVFRVNCIFILYFSQETYNNNNLKATIYVMIIIFSIIYFFVKKII